MECTLDPRILILDNDPNFLSQCKNELQKYGMSPMAGNAAAAVTTQITQYKPDVIITDLYIGKIDSAQFIKQTRSKATDNNLQFIVLSYYNDRNLFQECCEAGAAYCMIKPIDFTVLSERIGRVCYQPKEKFPTQIDFSAPLLRQADLKSQITQVLHQVGIPAHIKGYAFLRFAILKAVEDSEVLELVTKILYPTVAREFQTTATRVERAIRHAIEVAWGRGNDEAQRALFGYTAQSNRGKPTNSEFIALIADNLRLQNRRTED